MFLFELLARLPLSVLYFITDIVYLFLYYVWGFRKELTRGNVARSFPDKSPEEVERIARTSVRRTCNLVAEILKAETMASEDLRRRLTVTNLDAPRKYFAENKPVIFVTSHHCNWEWLLLVGCLEYQLPADAIYKPLRLKAADGFMRKLRSRFGGDPISVGNFLFEARKRKTARIFALVADQTPKRNEEKYWTRFLNQDTAFYTGVDRIARITQAPVYFAAMRRLKRGYYEATLELLAEPPYSKHNIVDVVGLYARAAEAQIARYPEEWLWLYRKWKYPKPQEDE